MASAGGEAVKDASLEVDMVLGEAVASVAEAQVGAKQVASQASTWPRLCATLGASPARRTTPSSLFP